VYTPPTIAKDLAAQRHAELAAKAEAHRLRHEALIARRAAKATANPTAAPRPPVPYATSGPAATPFPGRPSRWRRIVRLAGRWPATVDLTNFEKDKGGARPTRAARAVSGDAQLADSPTNEEAARLEIGD
jgi:hypothetical protein